MRVLFQCNLYITLRSNPYSFYLLDNITLWSAYIIEEKEMKVLKLKIASNAKRLTVYCQYNYDEFRSRLVQVIRVNNRKKEGIGEKRFFLIMLRTKRQYTYMKRKEKGGY
jgi:hypothetical protein